MDWVARKLFWLVRLLWSPAALIAIGGPALMQLMNERILATIERSRLPASGALEAGIAIAAKEAVTLGNYACGILDVKMQAYAFLAAFAILMVEFSRRIVTIRFDPHLDVKVSSVARDKPGKNYVLLCSVYFLLVGIFAVHYFVSVFDLNTIAAYVQGCGETVRHPPLTLLTALRYSLLVPGILLVQLAPPAEKQ